MRRLLTRIITWRLAACPLPNTSPRPHTTLAPSATKAPVSAYQPLRNATREARYPPAPAFDHEQASPERALAQLTALASAAHVQVAAPPCSLHRVQADDKLEHRSCSARRAEHRAELRIACLASPWPQGDAQGLGLDAELSEPVRWGNTRALSSLLMARCPVHPWCNPSPSRRSSVMRSHGHRTERRQQCQPWGQSLAGCG